MNTIKPGNDSADFVQHARSLGTLRGHALRLVLALTAMIAAGIASHDQRPASAMPAQAASAPTDTAHKPGQLPLFFEANRGQTDASVSFVTRGRGYSAFASPGALTFNVGDGQGGHGGRHGLRIALDHADPQAPIRGESPLPGRSHYFHGQDARQWQHDVPQFGQVRYSQVYPGIDWVLHGSGAQLEHDFVVAAGADPQRIRYAIEGADALSLRDDGSLEARVGERVLVQHPPLAYQDRDGQRLPVAVRAVMQPSDSANPQATTGGDVATTAMTLAFAVGDYDHSLPLVIDPVYEYSSYLGGSGAEAFGGGNGSGELATKVAIDAAGNLYIAGLTASSDFPATPGAVQPSLTPTGSSCSSDPIDVFVAKFDPTGQTLIYATYLGGSCTEQPAGLKVDSDGNAYLFGTTESEDFPITPGVIQSTPGTASSQVFLSKLAADGSELVYSTFLGGPTGESADGFALDALGQVFVAGVTFGDFPTTSGAYRETCIPFFSHYLAKVNADASALVFGTCWGEGDAANHPLRSAQSQQALAVDAAGEALVTGLDDAGVVPVTPGAFDTTFGGSFDGFVIKFKADGSDLVYATYLGGSGNDQPTSIAADAAGNAYVTGFTTTGFPTTAGAVQPEPLPGANGGAFAAKLNAAGTALIYGTYLGGGGGNSTGIGRQIAVDGGGRALIVGAFMPVVDAPPEACNAASALQLLRLNADASAIDFGFPVGGGATFSEGFDITRNLMSDLAVDGDGNVAVAGITNSATFPTYHAFQPALAGPGDDAFVARFSTGPSLPKPTLQFSAGTFTADPAGGSALITVRRNGRAAGPLRVHAFTSDGSAIAGTDYTAVDTTLNWSDGDLSDKSFSVPLINPAALGKTVNLTLDAPACTAMLGTPTTAVLTLGAAPGDPGTLQFSSDRYTVNEDAGPATITVVRVGGTNGSLSATFSTADGSANAGSDYQSLSQTVAFADGEGGSKTVEVPIIDDSLVEPNETVLLSLSSGGAVGSASHRRVAPHNTSPGDSATLTIVDNDAIVQPRPGSLQFGSPTYRVNENGSAVTISVTRSGGSNGAVGVRYASSDGSATAGADYSAASGTLSWADGDTAPKTFEVPILDDAQFEDEETFGLQLSAPSGGAALGTLTTANVSIDDDDTVVAAPGSLQFGSPSYSVNENGGEATITVTRSGGGNGTVSVRYASRDGSASAGADYMAASGTLSWADGDTAPKTFRVTILQDQQVEGTETVKLSLSAPGGGAVLGADADSVLRIADDDAVQTVAVDGGAYAGGGSTGFGLLAGLAALAGLRRRRSIRLRAGFIDNAQSNSAGKGASAMARQAVFAGRLAVLAAAAAVAPANAAAPAQSSPSDDLPASIYLGLRAGVGLYEQPGHLRGELRRRGEAVRSDVDDHPFAGEIHLGVPVWHGLAVELGYAELGKYDVELSGVTADPQRLARDVADGLRPAGHGLTFGFGGAVPLIDRWLWLAPHFGGVYYWSTQHARINDFSFDVKDHGFGVSIGAGLLLRVTDHIRFGAGFESYRLELRPAANQVGAQLEYHFGGF